MSDRYSRQTILAEVGTAGQARLRGATVLVVGAGGLGCACNTYALPASVDSRS
jgi:molybdopterin/thiamine biosynthesis adenylyltransferase